MIKSHVHFIKMGGTIEFFDPSYDAINKKLMRLDTTIESYLNHIIQPHFDFSTESVAEKDSRDITDDDRERLAKAIEATSHTNIVITHGTFTMSETAVFLDNRLTKDKKVILTGSMIPIVGFSTSDAGFNLGYVIGSFSGIESGVFISMNGGLFHSDEIKKNVESFRFE